MLRALEGTLFFAYLFATINIGALLLLIAFIFVRPFSRRVFIRFALFLQDTYLAQLVYLITRNTNLVVEETGDDVPKGESALILPNHQNHDYLVLYNWAYDKGRLANVRTFLKSETKFIPGWGVVMWLCDWPYVSRDWSKDEKYLKDLFRRYKDDEQPLWLWLFPEGTRLTPKKKKASQEYAKQKGYTVFEHVMLPRPKGFTTSIRCLEGTIQYVYDVTLAYSGWDGRFPGPLELLFLDPKKAYSLHYHVERIPIASLPKTDDGLKDWLMESFKRKDKLLEKFSQEGHFAEKRRLLKFSQNDFVFPFLFWGSLLGVSTVLSLWALF